MARAFPDSRFSAALYSRRLFALISPLFPAEPRIHPVEFDGSFPFLMKSNPLYTYVYDEIVSRETISYPPAGRALRGT